MIKVRIKNFKIEKTAKTKDRSREDDKYSKPSTMPYLRSKSSSFKDLQKSTLFQEDGNYLEINLKNDNIQIKSDLKGDEKYSIIKQEKEDVNNSSSSISSQKQSINSKYKNYFLFKFFLYFFNIL